MSDIKTKKTNKEQQCPQLNRIIVTIGPELSHSIVANYSTCVGPATYLQARQAAYATAKSRSLPHRLARTTRTKETQADTRTNTITMISGPPPHQ